MKFSRIALLVVMMHSYTSYSMEHFFDALKETEVQRARTFVAWRNGEEQLLVKSETSPLPMLPHDLVQKIALNLDRTSMFRFAQCGNKAIYEKLNSSHRWAREWHQDGERAPLKVIQDYVVYNENLLEQCIVATPDQLCTQSFNHLFQHELADPNYCRIGKMYWKGVLYDTESFLNKPKTTVYEKAFGNGELFFKPMLYILCAKAHHSEFVCFLLEKGADPNPNSSYGHVPIQEAIHAFDGGNPLFVGNVTRCVSLVETLLEHKADIHYKDSKGSGCLHRLPFVADAHLLLPYFLNKGINQNAQDDDGNTALISWAVIINWFSEHGALPQERKDSTFESVRLLIEAKADPNVRNNRGESFFDILPRELHEDVQAIIDKQ